MFKPADRIRHIKPSTIRNMFDRGKDCINLGLGEPAFFAPEVIRQEAARVAMKEKLPYTPNFGLDALRRKIVEEFYEGSDVERILVTAGSQEALFATVLAFVNPGDEVLIPDPGFLAYPTLVRIAGGTAVTYRLRGERFEFDGEAFERALSPRTRMVLLNSPSNPTGQVLTAADLETIARLVGGRDILVVSDEIYRHVYFDQLPASYYKFDSNALIASGFSKAYSMTGWRLGWLYGPAEALERVNLVHSYVTTCASTLSQKAALAAFSEEGRQQREELRVQLGRRRDAMMRQLDTQLGLPFVEPVASFYFLLDVSRFGSSAEVAERCLAAGVITVPGSAFGPACEGFLRLSCCAEPAILQEGIRRIANALSLAPVTRTKD